MSIFAFGGPGKDSSQLGLFLANQLADLLSIPSRAVFVVSTAQLDSAARQHQIPLTNLSDPRVARWVSEQAGAQAILAGHLERTGSSLIVRIEIHDCAEPKKPHEFVRKIVLTSEMEELLNRPREQPQAEEKTKPAIAQSPQASEAGKRNVSYPACRNCPNPAYTDLARKEKYNGGVVLRVIVTAEGRAANITVARGAPFGLNEAAINAVKKWTFKPAATPDGQPVNAWTMIEINFRIY